MVCCVSGALLGGEVVQHSCCRPGGITHAAAATKAWVTLLEWQYKSSNKEDGPTLSFPTSVLSKHYAMCLIIGDCG